YVPTPQERITINTLASSSQVSINTIKATIANLQAVILNLQSRLSNYRAYNGFQCSLLSPIRKLPKEILGHIFSYVSGHCILVENPRSGSIWDLQQVCVHWRDTVRETPLLWN
ncbi:hypothetical protein BDQ17DRAFT_1168315, partial [Cyathus striatus]